MSDTNDSTLQIPMGSAADIKAVESLLSWKVVNVKDKEMMDGLFPSQSTLLDKLKQKGLPPEKICELSLKEKNFNILLYNFGLEFKSFKEAGVSPSSLLGLETVCTYNGVFSDSSWNSSIDIYTLIENFGFTAKDLLEDGIKDKDIPAKYLVTTGYSLEQMKKIGTCFITNKRLFPLEKIVNSYDLKTLCHGGIPAKELVDKHSYSELYAAGYSPRALQKAGADAKILREFGVPAKKLRRGFRFYDFHNERNVYGAFFSVEELKDAGYVPLELKKAGISAKKMKDAGFSRNDLEGIYTKGHLDKIYNS